MLIAPSLLASDLANLTGSAALCAEGGADVLHLDVMDGRFVPNLTFGAPVVRALAAKTSIPLDVHLMVEDPGRLLSEYLEAGAAWLSFHWEAATHHDRLLQRIRDAGARCGLALNPATPVEVLYDVLEQLDFVLLMSVNPGFAGQEFLPYIVDKARRLAQMIRDRSARVIIAMDGGIGPENIGEIAAAGTGLCVAGSAIFSAADPVGAMRRLREAAGEVSRC